MTAATRHFLRYLAAYLDEQPGRRATLKEYHREKTKKKLHNGNLARHLAAINEPGMDTAIVYMLFLHRAGELTGGKKGGALFEYRRPQLIR